MEPPSSIRNAARKHWRELACAWALPFFLVLIYIPLEKWLHGFRWLLWLVVGLPALLFSLWLASAPYRRREVTWWQHFILVNLALFPLLLFAVALNELLTLAR